MHKRILFALISLFSFIAANAASIVWNGGGADSLASTAANWSGGVPQLDDEIVFNNTSSKPCYFDIDPGSMGFMRWDQQAGYTGVVTIFTQYSGGFDTLYISGNCNIDGGMLTHQGHDSGEVQTYRLCIKIGGDLTVGSGGAIDLTGQGYRARDWPAPGYGSYGASHGGKGGSRSNTYGSVLFPVTIGSHANSHDGSLCRGGGAALIIVGGNTTLSGSIIANGMGARNSGGGGAGGSINLATATLSGRGKS